MEHPKDTNTKPLEAIIAFWGLGVQHPEKAMCNDFWDL
jgi:hypothetical protein